MTSSAIVQKLWNYCNVLRDDGMSYGDYVEQLTYLLFLKMADERTKPPHSQASIVPDECNWPSLVKRDGDELFDDYRHVLEKLGDEKGGTRAPANLIFRFGLDPQDLLFKPRYNTRAKQRLAGWLVS